MPKLLERNRELATQMVYFNRVSTEDYAASFTSTERGKKMVKQVKTVGRSRKHVLELSEMQAHKEKVQTHPTQDTANE